MSNWAKIAYLPVQIRNPDTGRSAFVKAKLQPGSFFGLYADLAKDVIRQLQIAGGQEFQGIDDDNDLITFCWAKVEIRFRNFVVTGPANINSNTDETTLFGHFLGKIPADADLSTFVRTAPAPIVFMSYSHQDKRFVRTLAKSLTERGIGVWLDEGEIRIGESLIERLRKAIDSVDYVLAILSPASVNSAWVQKELDIAMNQEIEGRRVKVLPLLKAECDLPGFLKGKLFADFRRKHIRRRVLEKLVDSIVSLP